MYIYFLRVAVESSSGKTLFSKVAEASGDPVIMFVISN